MPLGLLTNAQAKPKAKKWSTIATAEACQSALPPLLIAALDASLDDIDRALALMNLRIKAHATAVRIDDRTRASDK